MVKQKLQKNKQHAESTFTHCMSILYNIAFDHQVIINMLYINHLQS